MAKEFNVTYFTKLHDEINSAIKEKVVLLATVEVLQSEAEEKDTKITTLESENTDLKAEVENLKHDIEKLLGNYPNGPDEQPKE